MKTINEIKEMDIEDLKDELVELGDKIKYSYSNMRDIKYFRKLENEFNNRT